MKTPQRLAGEVELPGMEGSAAAAQVAVIIAEAQELSERLRTPLGSISGRAGQMERDSPLFFGSGENPLLF